MQHYFQKETELDAEQTFESKLLCCEHQPKLLFDAGSESGKLNIGEVELAEYDEPNQGDRQVLVEPHSVESRLDIGEERVDG